MAVTAVPSLPPSLPSLNASISLATALPPPPLSPSLSPCPSVTVAAPAYFLVSEEGKGRREARFLLCRPPNVSWPQRVWFIQLPDCSLSHSAIPREREREGGMECEQVHCS